MSFFNNIVRLLSFLASTLKIKEHLVSDLFSLMMNKSQNIVVFYRLSAIGTNPKIGNGLPRKYKRIKTSNNGLIKK